MSKVKSNSTTIAALAANEGQQNENAHLAQLAQAADSQTSGIATPLIPDTVYNNLPDFLKTACEPFEGRERDVFFTAALTALSGCFSSVKGIYYHQELHSNLFGMVIADAASGKGNASHARALIEPIHQTAMAASVTESGDGANRTPFIIPANISSAAMIGTLAQSGGTGVMFETEIDTLTDTLKQEWAGYSDLLRKAFHHEPVTLARKTNNEYIEVRRPQPSMLLTGTPGQAITLLRSPENGLMSRFIFYYFSNPVVWQDVFSTNKPNLTEYFAGLGRELLTIHEQFKSGTYTFDLTPQQKLRHFDEFTRRMTAIGQLEPDAVSTLKRLGLIVFRIAMVLSIIRASDVENIESNLTCQDVDFDTAITLSGVYLEHALHVLDLLPKTESLRPDLMRFFETLPVEFTRAEALAVALRLGFKERVVAKYLSMLEGQYIQRVKHGHYKKK